MIHDQRAFIVFPAIWEPPFFKMGERVQAGDIVGEIVGFEYYTREQAELARRDAGWWYMILERKTFESGRSYADTWGEHESVIQRVPSSAVPVLQQPVTV